MRNSKVASNGKEATFQPAYTYTKQTVGCRHLKVVLCMRPLVSQDNHIVLIQWNLRITDTFGTHCMFSQLSVPALHSSILSTSVRVIVKYATTLNSIPTVF